MKLLNNFSFPVEIKLKNEFYVKCKIKELPEEEGD